MALIRCERHSNWQSQAKENGQECVCVCTPLWLNGAINLSDLPTNRRFSTVFFCIFHKEQESTTSSFTQMTAALAIDNVLSSFIVFRSSSYCPRDSTETDAFIHWLDLHRIKKTAQRFALLWIANALSTIQSIYIEQFSIWLLSPCFGRRFKIATAIATSIKSSVYKMKFLLSLRFEWGKNDERKLVVQIN